MPTLECDTCTAEEDFPSTLTVVEEEIDGWALEISVIENSDALRVDAAYCPDCQ